MTSTILDQDGLRILDQDGAQLLGFDMLGGGDATTTGFVSGGGGAKYGGAYGGMLYSLAEGKLALSGDLVAAGGTFQGELTAGAVVTGGVTIQAGGSMQSDNYVPDTAGWRITDTGIEIDDGTFRGQLVAATGSFTGELTAASGTFSGALGIGFGTSATLIKKIEVI